MPKIAPGEVGSLLPLNNIDGAPVEIPDNGRMWVYLHFAPLAGCPICNAPLQGLIAASRKLAAASVRGVVVLHSPTASLLPYHRNFRFDVIGDPDKVLYRQFGVEASPRSLLDPRVWPTLIRANFAPDKP